MYAASLLAGSFHSDMYNMHHLQHYGGNTANIGNRNKIVTPNVVNLKDQQIIQQIQLAHMQDTRKTNSEDFTSSSSLSTIKSTMFSNRLTRPFLDSAFLSKYPDFPSHMNALGQFVALRTYSRYVPGEDRRESWKETCHRAVEYNIYLEWEHLKQMKLPIHYQSLKREAELLFDNMFNLRQFLSGRTLWIGGTDAALKFPLSNFNCSFLNICSWKDLAHDLFYLLLVGTGVGFKCTKQMAQHLPKIRTGIKLIHSEFQPLEPEQRLERSMFMELPNGYVKIYIGDSKEGWVEALYYFFMIATEPKYEKIHTIKISYNSIRPRGERLKSFGGTASGYEPLKEMFEGIHKVLTNQIDPHLPPIELDERGYGNVRPIHILDIANLIGNNVVVGGVRRTSEICLFDWDDHEVLLAKYGMNGLKKMDVEHHEKVGQLLETNGIKKPKWFDNYDVATMDENSPTFLRMGIWHRCMSNNSIAFTTKPPHNFMNLVFAIMQGEGEPGFVNLEEANRRRSNAEGLNPCVTADTMVLTSEGSKSVAELLHKPFTAIVHGKEYPSTSNGFWSTGVKDVYKMTLTNGLEIKATSNHQFLTKAQKEIDGLGGEGELQQCQEWKELGQLKQHDVLILSRNNSYRWDNKIGTYFEGYCYGKYLITCQSRITNDNETRKSIQQLAQQYEIDLTTNQVFESGSYDFCKGLIQRLFDEYGRLPNGGNPCLGFYDNNLDMLKSVQRILWNMGIPSTLTKDKLLIHSSASHHYYQSVGFSYHWRERNVAKLLDRYKNVDASNTDHLDYFTSSILSIEKVGQEQVYDCTIPQAHCFAANGIIAHNCAEILLDSYGVCNLTTVNLTQFVKNGQLLKDELIQAQRLSARCGLRMTLVTLELPHWDEIQKRDRLLGTSFTGVKDAMDELGYTAEQENQLIEELSKAARDEANNHSARLRVCQPLLVTTVKPEGTLSQVCGGVSPGLHVSHSPYYIRRIRINAADPLVGAPKELGWPIHPENFTPGDTEEERMANARTLVVDFPVKCSAKRTKTDVDVKEQMATYFQYQKLYTEHNSSNTITVRDHEWDELQSIIYNNWDRYVGVSFLKLDGGTYNLTPYEECTKEEYESLLAKMKPLTMDLVEKYEKAHLQTKKLSNQKQIQGDMQQGASSEIINNDSPSDVGESECVGGVCPLR